MMPRQMVLFLNDLKVDCIIGDLPEERVKLQTLILDVELGIPTQAAETDELSDTVDYATLSDKIRNCLVEAKCRMIERAALLAARVCLQDNLVNYALVRVTKTGAIPMLGSASTVIRLDRDALGSVS